MKLKSWRTTDANRSYSSDYFLKVLFTSYFKNTDAAVLRAVFSIGLHGFRQGYFGRCISVIYIFKNKSIIFSPKC